MNATPTPRALVVQLMAADALAHVYGWQRLDAAVRGNQTEHQAAYEQQSHYIRQRKVCRDTLQAVQRESLEQAS